MPCGTMCGSDDVGSALCSMIVVKISNVVASVTLTGELRYTVIAAVPAFHIFQGHPWMWRIELVFAYVRRL